MFTYEFEQYYFLKEFKKVLKHRYSEFSKKLCNMEELKNDTISADHVQIFSIKRAHTIIQRL